MTNKKARIQRLNDSLSTTLILYYELQSNRKCGAVTVDSTNSLSTWEDKESRPPRDAYDNINCWPWRDKGQFSVQWWEYFKENESAQGSIMINIKCELRRERNMNEKARRIFHFSLYAVSLSCEATNRRHESVNERKINLWTMMIMMMFDVRSLPPFARQSIEAVCALSFVRRRVGTLTGNLIFFSLLMFQTK